MDYPHIMIMKAGSYCGYSLNEIIQIKTGEEKAEGRFYWGYSGVFCYPNTVMAFVRHALNQNQKPYVLFTKTESVFDTKNSSRFEKYSVDNKEWIPLPENVLLVGNNKKPHHAIIGRHLSEVNFSLDLGGFCVFRNGLLDSRVNLDDYFRYRVDKACAGLLSSRNKKAGRNVIISYLCELVKPYCVYIR